MQQNYIDGLPDPVVHPAKMTNLHAAMEENLLIQKLRELFARDFVHRKSIESDLYRSEEKYRMLIDQLTDAIYLSTWTAPLPVATGRCWKCWAIHTRN